MPEDYKAESIIVQPTPSTAAETGHQMDNILRSVAIAQSVAPLPADQHYGAGFEGGLALAIDHGIETAKKVLAIIDARKGAASAARGDPDPAGTVHEDAVHRAALMSQISDAAEGRPVRDVHGEVKRLGGNVNNSLADLLQQLRDGGLSFDEEEEPGKTEFHWS